MSDEEPQSLVVASAGEPLGGGITPATKDDVTEALRTVFDPEIPVNIYDLGLIYKLDVGENGDVAVEMTLTAPSCPAAGALPQQVADAASTVQGTGEVSVALVWDPPWTMDNLSIEAKLALNL